MANSKNILFKFLRYISLTFLIAFGFISIIASGGGGGGNDSPTTTNVAPTALTGGDQTVAEGTLVTLDASNSTDADDGIASYLWQQTEGPAVTVSNANAIQPTFSAPDVGPTGAALTFELTVTDNGGLKSTATCIVNVTWVNKAPTAVTGSDQTVAEGSLVTLDASNSTDVDDGIASYLWQQTEGPVATLSDASAIQPTFTAPVVGTSGVALTFKLTVTDNGGLKSTATCVVNVTWVNVPPTAVTGPDQTVAEGTLVTLDASNSTDVDDGVASYLWQQTEGPVATLSDASAIQPAFIAPNVDLSGGALKFKLTVTDNGGLKSTATCTINVTCQYVITDLGTLGGTESEAWGINNYDDVVGLAHLAGDAAYHAFLYSQGVMTDLGCANCTDTNGKSVAWDINDSGQIAGESCFWLPGNATRAFIYDEGVMVDIGTIAGTNSMANDINNNGHVVGGAAIKGDQTTHAFLYKDDLMTDLGVLGQGGWSFAYGINDADQVVGASYYSNPGSVTHAFLYENGAMTDLTPSTTYSSGTAYDINNAGQIVGTGGIQGQDNHAFLYSGGALTFLGVLGPGSGAYGTGKSEAYGINNSGRIVGGSTTNSTNVYHTFVYDNGVMTDLNTLLPTGSGWELNYALDINDNGSIVGVGTINSESHAFLMVPLIP